MTPAHHPSEAVLADYAAGALRTQFASVVAAHLEFCPRCRATVGRLEAVGFALLESLPAAEMAGDRLARAMDRLDLVPETSEAPAPIAFGPERLDDAGVALRFAPDWAGGELLSLVRLPAGMAFPPHTHHAQQFVTILEGAYDDEGEVFAAGDFCELGGSRRHNPIVVSDADCVCLVANEPQAG